MTAASDRVEATVEPSSAYESFRVDDDTGRRVGDARTLFLVDARPRYLQVELRGLFSHRYRIVPWELAMLDEHKGRIRLHCPKRALEDAPEFDAQSAFDPQARRARVHFRLPAEVPDAEVPDERAPEEPADRPVDEADAPQAALTPPQRDNERSVAEDLRARIGRGAQTSLARERSHAPDDDGNEKEEEMASEVQAGEAVPITPDNADEPRVDTDQVSRGYRRDAAEEDAFRLGTRSSQGWQPTFDVAQVDDGYLVAIDVPGVEADALELRLEDDLLTVSGERVARADGDLQRRGSPSGPFVCRFRLPAHTNAEAVAAELKNGVLELRIPRSAAPEARRIALRRSGD
jgi:HSP20 family protein